MATQSDQTNTGVITTIVVVGAFAMITISAMVTALVRAQHAEVDAERPTNADLDTVASVRKSQLEHITAAASWVEGDKGRKLLHIPIERAMSAVVDEYKKKPEAASPPPPPGLVMPPSTPGPTAPNAAAPGSSTAPNAGAPGAPSAPAPGAATSGGQPTPATPSAAAPNPATPDPASTQRVVPPPTAPGPAPSPAPTGRP